VNTENQQHETEIEQVKQLVFVADGQRSVNRTSFL